MFRDVLSFCNFFDVGFVGPKFTWKRGNSTQTNIKVVRKFY